MHEPINCRHGGHRVLEDLIPFREHQVAGDHHAAPLVAFGKEREQHFHFLPDGAGNKIATAEHQSRRKSLWRKLVQSDGGADIYQKAFGKRQNHRIFEGESSGHFFRVQSHCDGGDVVVVRWSFALLAECNDWEHPDWHFPKLQNFGQNTTICAW